MNIPRFFPQLLVLIGYGDLVGLLDIVAGPAGTAQDALVTSIIEFMFFPHGITDVIPLGEHCTSLAGMKLVAAAVFVTVALAARAKGLEHFSKRRDGGCDNGNSSLGSSPNHDVATIVLKRYVSELNVSKLDRVVARVLLTYEIFLLG